MADAIAVADLARVLEDDPKAAAIARRALAIHGQHRRQEQWPWLGFGWDELKLTGVSWHDCTRLCVAGVLEVAYKSRSQTLYKLLDSEATALALNAIREEVTQPEASLPDYPVPDDLFDIIVGLEDAKWASRLAVKAAAPAHIGYLGPPGSAKTEFLRELARLPGARMVTGGATSRVGIEDTFLDAPAGQAPRFLLYDELEKAPAADAAALLSLAEEGVLRVTKHRRMREWRGLVSIFVTCNRLPEREELVDRFTWLRFEPYSESDFQAVCFNYLARRERLDPELRPGARHPLRPPHSLGAPGPRRGPALGWRPTPGPGAGRHPAGSLLNGPRPRPPVPRRPVHHRDGELGWLSVRQGPG